MIQEMLYCFYVLEKEGNKMKNLRKLVGISILFVLVAMMVALIQFQEEEELSELSEQVEYFFDDGWALVSLEGVKGVERDRKAKKESRS